MSSQPHKILVVDDEADVVNSLKESLEACGYQVLTAPDGIAAVETARTQMPGLILLDLMLPMLDGYRVLKLLKSDERYRKIPIIVVTARANAEDWALAVECGADGWVVKPVRTDSLLERVRTHLGTPNGR